MEKLRCFLEIILKRDIPRVPARQTFFINVFTYLIATYIQTYINVHSYMVHTMLLLSLYFSYKNFPASFYTNQKVMLQIIIYIS